MLTRTDLRHLAEQFLDEADGDVAPAVEAMVAEPHRLATEKVLATKATHAAAGAPQPHASAATTNA